MSEMGIIFSLVPRPAGGYSPCCTQATRSSRDDYLVVLGPNQLGVETPAKSILDGLFGSFLSSAPQGRGYQRLAAHADARGLFVRYTDQAFGAKPALLARAQFGFQADSQEALRAGLASRITSEAPRIPDRIVGMKKAVKVAHWQAKQEAYLAEVAAAEQQSAGVLVTGDADRGHAAEENSLDEWVAIDSQGGTSAAVVVDAPVPAEETRTLMIQRRNGAVEAFVPGTLSSRIYEASYSFNPPESNAVASSVAGEVIEELYAVAVDGDQENVVVVTADQVMQATFKVMAEKDMRLLAPTRPLPATVNALEAVNLASLSDEALINLYRSAYVAS